jgi:hypothetical protein
MVLAVVPSGTLTDTGVSVLFMLVTLKTSCTRTVIIWKKEDLFYYLESHLRQATIPDKTSATLPII